MRQLSIMILFGFLVFALLFPIDGEAANPSFGNSPVTFMVAAGPGGAEDLAARALAPLMKQRLNVAVNVENFPGAGGKMAFNKLQKAEPDGHTLSVYTFPKSIILEYMDKTNYRTRDFTPVYAWSKTYPLLVVPAESPFKSFDEFAKAAKAKPLSGGVSNRGGVIHLVSLIFMDEIGAKVKWVPFDSSAESLTALAGKHIDFVISLTGSAASLLDAGKIRPLLLIADQRDPFVPNVQTPKELGFTIPSVPSIHAAMAPPKTPAATVKILETAFTSAAKDPMFLDFMKNRKMTVDHVPSEELGAMVKDLYPRIEKIAPALKSE
jgi:tripartite-type tricarboxylate transporter receptor subunit TctC